MAEIEKWFRDEVSDLSLGLQAFAILERHFPEAEADYRDDKKHCTKWSYVCWELGRSMRRRLPDRRSEKSFRKLFADLSEFCSEQGLARLLFELSEDGRLPDRLLRWLPNRVNRSSLLKHLSDLQRLKDLEEEALRRMDQMGY